MVKRSKQNVKASVSDVHRSEIFEETSMNMPPSKFLWRLSLQNNISNHNDVTHCQLKDSASSTHFSFVMRRSTSTANVSNRLTAAVEPQLSSGHVMSHPVSHVEAAARPVSSITKNPLTSVMIRKRLRHLKYERNSLISPRVTTVRRMPFTEVDHRVLSNDISNSSVCPPTGNTCNQKLRHGIRHDVQPTKLNSVNEPRVSNKKGKKNYRTQCIVLTSIKTPKLKMESRKRFHGMQVHKEVNKIQRLSQQIKADVNYSPLWRNSIKMDDTVGADSLGQQSQQIMVSKGMINEHTASRTREVAIKNSNQYPQLHQVRPHCCSGSKVPICSMKSFHVEIKKTERKSHVGQNTAGENDLIPWRKSNKMDGTQAGNSFSQEIVVQVNNSVESQENGSSTHGVDIKSHQHPQLHEITPTVRCSSSKVSVCYIKSPHAENKKTESDSLAEQKTDRFIHTYKFQTYIELQPINVKIACEAESENSFVQHHVPNFSKTLFLPGGAVEISKDKPQDIGEESSGNVNSQHITKPHESSQKFLHLPSQFIQNNGLFNYHPGASHVVDNAHNTNKLIEGTRLNDLQGNTISHDEDDHIHLYPADVEEVSEALSLSLRKSRFGDSKNQSISVNLDAGDLHDANRIRTGKIENDKPSCREFKESKLQYNFSRAHNFDSTCRAVDEMKKQVSGVEANDRKVEIVDKSRTHGHGLKWRLSSHEDVPRYTGMWRELGHNTHSALSHLGETVLGTKDVVVNDPRKDTESRLDDGSKCVRNGLNIDSESATYQRTFAFKRKLEAILSKRLKCFEASTNYPNNTKTLRY